MFAVYYNIQNVVLIKYLNVVAALREVFGGQRYKL